MQELFEKNKTIIIAGTVILVLLIIGIMIMFSGKPQQDETDVSDTDEQLDEPIPTVDPSVEVSLEAINNNQDVVVTVENVPEGTEEIEVEISYEREEPELDSPIADGSFAVMEPEGNRAETEIKLGTCSSGVCRYHTLTTGEIRTVLKFNGEYGERLYENTFTIEL